MVFVNGRTYAIDVAIVRESADSHGHKSNMTTKFTEKMREYREYQEENPTHTIFPFIMSVYGSFHPTSVELLTELCKQMKVDTFFRQDVLRHTQCALLKSLYSAFLTTKTKHEAITRAVARERDGNRAANT